MMPRPFRLPRVTEDESVKAEDRIAISDIVARYADAVNANDAVAWGATWAQECTWEPGTGRVLHGRDEVVAFWQTAMASFESVIQVVGHGHASEAGGGAVGCWTLFEVNRRGGANGIVLGHYRDRYVRAQGSWLFAERLLTVTYRGGLPDGGFTAFRSLTGTGQ
jgi:hypothetical protein